MNEMNRHLKAIELDKVLSMVAERACNDDAKEAILNLGTDSKYPGRATYRAMLLTTALEHPLALGVHSELLWSVNNRIYHQL